MIISSFLLCAVLHSDALSVNRALQRAVAKEDGYAIDAASRIAPITSRHLQIQGNHHLTEHGQSSNVINRILNARSAHHAGSDLRFTVQFQDQVRNPWFTNKDDLLHALVSRQQDHPHSDASGASWMDRRSHPQNLDRASKSASHRLASSVSTEDGGAAQRSLLSARSVSLLSRLVRTCQDPGSTCSPEVTEKLTKQIFEQIEEVEEECNKSKEHIEAITNDSPQQPFEVGETAEERENAKKRHRNCREEENTMAAANATCFEELQAMEAEVEDCTPSLAQKTEYSCERSGDESEEEYLSSLVQDLSSATNRLYRYRRQQRICNQSIENLESQVLTCHDLNASLIRQRTHCVHEQEKLELRACIAWGWTDSWQARCEEHMHAWERDISFVREKEALAKGQIDLLWNMLCDLNGTFCNQSPPYGTCEGPNFTAPPPPNCPGSEQSEEHPPYEDHPCTATWADEMESAKRNLPHVELQPCTPCWTVEEPTPVPTPNPTQDPIHFLCFNPPGPEMFLLFNDASEMTDARVRFLFRIFNYNANIMDVLFHALGKITNLTGQTFHIDHHGVSVSLLQGLEKRTSRLMLA
jgi:hypothetical protein